MWGVHKKRLAAKLGAEYVTQCSLLLRGGGRSNKWITEYLTASDGFFMQKQKQCLLSQLLGEATIIPYILQTR